MNYQTRTGITLQRYTKGLSPSVKLPFALRVKLLVDIMALSGKPYLSSRRYSVLQKMVDIMRK
jgi:hypothetical protein